MSSYRLLGAFVLLSFIPRALCQDDLGVGNGYTSLSTANFRLQLVSDAQVLASLQPAQDSFDFLPYDYLPLRTRNGQYHWGDITYRYRETGGGPWIDGDSAVARASVTKLDTSSNVLAAASINPTLPDGPLNISREWLDESGDLALRFTLRNAGNTSLEIGSLGFPSEFNSIFTGRNASNIQAVCSLTDPYIGMHAGHLRVAPVRGTGPGLVVTPLGDTPLEAYRNLQEPWYDDTGYGSQTFEGFYEWQVLTKAWADSEWASIVPWNEPSSRTLQPGQSLQFGVRFSIANDGVREMDSSVRNTGTPIAIGVPGYIIPRGQPAQLHLNASSKVQDAVAVPAGSLSIVELTETSYTVTPAADAWGRVRLVITYEDGKIQTIHYFVTKPGTEVIADLGRFLITEQWFNDSSDPFGRAPSPLTYDYEAKALVTQDPRVWIAGLSDEAGAGSFLAACVKQALQPSAEEVSKLEAFVDKVLWGTIQTSDYGVRKSIFYYQPDALPGYPYDSEIDWGNWWSWNKASAYATDRAYDYVHVAAAYWALYRVARAYPNLTKSHAWDWYLNQAFQTAVRSTQPTVGYNTDGLMGETVFGEILADLTREGQTVNAANLTQRMRTRAVRWNNEEVPFGSEMAWDSTGQEGVYYWSKYFGFTNTMTKALNTVLGYMPTVPHWGWNGNARRYWDNVYGGKLQRIERQIHHYGSGLNSLVLLSGFRSTPNDTYLLRAGYGGTSGPLSNINSDGFAAASFHSWPDTLHWDGYSGDYGPGFLGMALGMGTYVVQDPDVGLVAFGGVLQLSGQTVQVVTTDPIRRRVFIGTLGIEILIDAGIIEEINYVAGDGTIDVTLGQLEGAPKAESAIVWIESHDSSTWNVTTLEATQERGGWKISFTSDTVSVRITSI